MDEKYTELIKEIAGIITDSNRESCLLRVQLDMAKAELDKAERRITELERNIMFSEIQEGVRNA